MHIVDILIFLVYMVVMLGVGFFFMKKNKSVEDYYVGGRSMGSWHVGLSVVATDVGGGFSIGLGGLGFTMGLSGSWMLFTGLVGAWLSAVFLISKIKRNPALASCLTFPDIFRHFYNDRVALLAGIISAVGYIGFTSSQILAGAKLASGTFPALDTTTALLVMGAIAVGYTVLGGIKAVIYTDTIQWIVLMSGLIFIGIPVAYHAVGGMEGLRATLPPDFLSLTNITWQQIASWTITILPIWFIAMTLYQRIYACRDERSAKKAWFIAGLFEWPVMALMGVLLGMFARAASMQGLLGGAITDAEKGLPILLSTILPVGLMGLMLSSYFSAILSTADSCLMAASGNVVSDILNRFFPIDSNEKKFLRISQLVTLLIGVVALLLATIMTSVLDLMLYSYSFMVSGLLVPVIGGLFWKRGTSAAAFWSMLIGGTTTVVLTVSAVSLPLQLDANVFGIAASFAVFLLLSLLDREEHTPPQPSLKPTSPSSGSAARQNSR